MTQSKSFHQKIDRHLPAITILLLLATSRGLLEAAFSKQAAYFIQAIAAILLLLYLRRESNFHAWTGRGSLHVALYVLLTTGLVSAWITQARWSLPSLFAPAFYLCTITFIMVLVVGGSEARRSPKRLKAFANAAGIVAVLHIVVAVAQQYGNWQLLGGSDFGSFQARVRPAGMTGSYLHYPLVLAVIAIAQAGMWEWRRRASHLAICLVSVAAVLSSLSRSGMMILAFTFLIGVLTGRSAQLKFWSVFAVVGASIYFLVLEPGNPVVARAISALDLESAGNVSRVRLWQEGVSLWGQTNLLFGDYMGLVTNVTRNFGEGTQGGQLSLGVVESSLVQQLLNFGLLGTVATYWILLRVPTGIDPTYTWVRAGMFAAVLQTLIYQSIEVLPFMALLAVMPLLFGASPAAAQLSNRSSEGSAQWNRVR